MSFTTDDIANLERAMATGALTVRNANGEMVTYRSLSEMQSVLALMKAEVSPSATGPVQFVVPTYSNGT